MLQFLKHIIIKFYSRLTLPQQRIIIMAHARSGSSLLEHILSSNPEILGSGEQSRIYKKKDDLVRMELLSRKSNRKYFKDYTYVVDQVLDNSLTPITDLFKENVKIIILIRNPDEAISSITYIAQKNSKNERFTPSKYYMDRISYLVNFSKSLKKENQFFITYNDLIHDTENTLNRLTKFLKLKKPLTKNYNLKNSTAKFGDPSDNIKSGTVIITKKELVDLEKDIKIKSRRLFKDTCSFFKTYLNQ